MRRSARCAAALSVVLVGCAAHARPNAVVTTHQEALPDDALDQHIKALATQLRLEGLTAGALRERGFLPPSGRVAYPVHIAAGECALFVALATASMADLDASLYTPDGAPLIEDDSTGSRPTLTFCASALVPVDGYLTLHAYQGAGSFVAAQFARPLRPDDDLHTAVGDGAASALGQLAQTLHERGFEDVAPRVSVSVGSGPVRMAVHVVAGECYTLAAEAGAGLSELGLRLVDAEGGELANGVGEPALAALQYCASDRAELSLELTAKRGQGVAQVGRFRATQAVVGGVRALWLGEPSPSPSAWSAIESRAANDNAAKVVTPFVSERVPLRQGEVFELATKPTHGACELWQAELAPGLSRVTLRIESDRGELLGEADSEHMSACLVICNAATSHRVTVLGRAGFGSALLTGSPLETRTKSGTEGQADLVFLPPTCHGSSARLEGR